MLGLMQETPLLISSLLDYAERWHPQTEIVSREADGSEHRYGYAEAAIRARRLASALMRAGVRQGDRVATLAMNHHRHFELYFGVSGMGAVLHTVNPRRREDAERLFEPPAAFHQSVTHSAQAARRAAAGAGQARSSRSSAIEPGPNLARYSSATAHVPCVSKALG